MNPTNPVRPLPADAGPELRKLAADVDGTLRRIDDEIERIEADVREIEEADAEAEARSDPLP